MKTKRTTKRFGALILALILMLTMAMPVLAATADITITNPDLESTDPDIAQNAKEHTYAGYRLLDLTTSLNCSKIHEHTDDCYNYSYTVTNEKYREIMQTVVFDATKDTDKELESEADVTDAKIIDYLSKLKSDDPGVDGSGSIYGFAEAVYGALKLDDTIRPDATGTEGLQDVAQGYWLIVDTTTLTGENDANSLLIVDTKGQEELDITPKKTVPSVVKKVKENTKEGTDEEWGDFADWNIGDNVPFQLTGTLPSNYDKFDEYKYIFHDDLCDNLSFNEDKLKVMVGATELIKNTDYTLVTEGITDGCDFHVVFTNLKDIKTATITKDTKIVVEYTAKLLASAEIGNDGNINIVELEFSNNPNGTGTGKTPEDKVVVFTFELDVTKVDDAGNELKDAEFVLYRYKADGTTKEYVEIGDGKTITGNKDKVTGWTDTKPTTGNLKSDENGLFMVIGLDRGTYYLEETKAPDGFTLLKDPIKLDITATYKQDAADVLHKVETLKIAVDNGEAADGDADAGKVAATVKNSTMPELPSTGGIGTTIFYIVGGILVVGAGVLLITRKRMETDANK